MTAPAPRRTVFGMTHAASSAPSAVPIATILRTVSLVVAVPALVMGGVGLVVPFVDGGQLFFEVWLIAVPLVYVGLRLLRYGVRGPAAGHSQPST